MELRWLAASGGCPDKAVQQQARDSQHTQARRVMRRRGWVGESYLSDGLGDHVLQGVR